jgi:hypothetical protein
MHFSLRNAVTYFLHFAMKQKTESNGCLNYYKNVKIREIIYNLWLVAGAIGRMYM